MYILGHNKRKYSLRLAYNVYYPLGWFHHSPTAHVTIFIRLNNSHHYCTKCTLTCSAVALGSFQLFYRFKPLKYISIQWLVTRDHIFLQPEGIIMYFKIFKFSLIFQRKPDKLLRCGQVKYDNENVFVSSAFLVFKALVSVRFAETERFSWQIS